jgi:hypothetical protein
MPDAATRDRLLRRIGLTEAPAPDAAGLRVSSPAGGWQRSYELG